MTDTATVAPAPEPEGIVVNLEFLRGMAAQIATLDEQISAASGSETAIKNSVLNKIATDNSAEVQRYIDMMIAEMAKLPVPVLAGFLHRLPEAAEEQFGPSVDELVDGQVKALTENVKDNIAPLKEQRKAKLETFRGVRAILNQIGTNTDSVPEPKRSAGRSAGSSTSASSATKTGKNKEGYRYAINGSDCSKSQNTLSSLAFYSTLGCVKADDEDPVKRAEHQAKLDKAPERWGVAMLKEFIAAQGVSLGAPGEGMDEWKVTLPNGKIVSARRFDEVKDKDIFDAVAEAEQAEQDDEADEGQPPAPVEPTPQPVG